MTPQVAEKTRQTCKAFFPGTFIRLNSYNLDGTHFRRVNIYWMPVMVDIRRDMTEEDRGPFGRVPLAGSVDLQRLLVCL